MTDNEIIKALECCSLIQGECKECPCDSVMDCDCEDMLLREAFYLINRQKAEIEKKDTEIEILIRKKHALRDEIAEQQAEKEHLEYVLMAVMHSVDKWLEGDELKQDEANRACTMREKTLKITEKLHKQIDGLKQANQEQWVAIEKRKAEIERLKEGMNFERERVDNIPNLLLQAKTEAYKEFAKLVNRHLNSNTPRGAYLHNIMKDVEKELTEGR